VTTTTAPSINPTSGTSISRIGRWCLVAALVGVLQGATLLLSPAQVADTRFSYPLTATGHVVAQATFFLQHVPLAVAVGALVATLNSQALRASRAGLIAATVGLSLLASTELVAMAAASADSDSTLAATVGGLYSVPVLLIGIRLTVGGLVLVRRTVGVETLARIMLAAGLFVFVGLVPALASGSFLAGRLAIMVWMLLFAALGWTMSGGDQLRSVQGELAQPDRSG